MVEESDIEALAVRDLEHYEYIAVPARRHEARLVAARCAHSRVQDAASPARRLHLPRPHSWPFGSIAMVVASRLLYCSRPRQASPRLVDGHVVPHVFPRLLARWLEQGFSAEAAAFDRSDVPAMHRRAGNGSFAAAPSATESVGVSLGSLCDGPGLLPIEFFAEFSRHWTRIFASPPVKQRAAESFLGQVAGMQVDVRLNFVDVKSAAAVSRDSAPGPDGVPCALWALDDRLLQPISCMAPAACEGHLPPHLCACRMVFIPNGEVQEGREHVAGRNSATRNRTMLKLALKIISPLPPKLCNSGVSCPPVRCMDTQSLSTHPESAAVR